MRMIRKCIRTLVFVSCFSVVGGCGSDDDAQNGGEGAPTRYRFALGSSVIGQPSTTYVEVFSDIPTGAALTLDNARSYGGYATVAAANGRLFVSEGESPRIDKYAIADDGALVAEGTVGFGNYFSSSVPLFTNVFVDAEHAFMQREETGRVAWNPETMEIRDSVVTDGPAATRNTLQVRASYDRAVVVRDNAVLQPYYWTDAAYFRFDPVSQIAIYDRTSGVLTSLIDAPCPGLDVASTAPNGDTLFSNWVYGAAAPALDTTAPKTCTLRLRAGATAFDTDAVIDLAALVGTSDTVGYRVLRDGTALVAVLDRTSLPNRALTATDITFGEHWRLWRVDADGTGAAVIDGLPLTTAGYYMAELSGRVLVMVTTADYARTTAYELLDDRSAVERFQIPGWAYQVVPLP
ncbi:MAG: MxcI [Clostridia bacterium]|nr:MxcI [Deltaproteobacteria bacterium]